MQYELHTHNPKNMARSTCRSSHHPRRQLASVYKKVYFGVKTITSPPSKPAVVFSLNEGDDKTSLPDVINSKILEYAHWSDIFTLRSLSDNQRREIDGNKSLVFNLTMQRLDEIIRNHIVKSNKSVNSHHFILKNRVSFMAKDRKLKTGYIIHFSNEFVSIVHCDDIFDERAVIKKMASAKVNHVRPFVGEVEEMVKNFTFVDPRVGI
jgi:hypothetical protein